MRFLLLCLSAGWIVVGTLWAEDVTDSTPSLFPVQGRGLNLGNFLEAPHEGDWSDKHLLAESDFVNIQQAGFTFVRVPIRWAAHVGPAPDFALDAGFLARVDWVVTQVQSHHLGAILDYHNDDALMKDPAANGERFVTIWKQIAAHYQGAPTSIAFELLNEPNKKLDAPQWNDLLARALNVVRATNPDRTVVVGPANWNNAWSLPKLVLPATDRHLVVTIHFYDPMKFTHQGASWVEGSTPWLGTTWLGTDAEKRAVTGSFDQAAKWGKDNQRPIYLGEFGSFSKGDMDSRARWTSFVARTAEERGMPWTYWEYCLGFGAYDPKAKQWRVPLLNALLQKP